VKNKIILLSLISIFILSGAFADTVVLKSGQQIEGTITERNQDLVRIDAYGVEMTYFISDIDKINGESVSAAGATSLPDEAEEGTAATEKEDIGPALSAEEAGPQDLSGSEPAYTAPGDAPLPQDAEEAVKKAEQIAALRNPALYNKAAAIGIAIVFLAVLIFLLVTHVYLAICLQLIARKTANEPAWLAWVPIGNFFLMCKIGSLNYIWAGLMVAALAVVFIPVIGLLGLLALIVLFAFFGYRIALARNKPGWVGILLCLPFAGLVILGYLAFTE